MAKLSVKVLALLLLSCNIYATNTIKIGAIFNVTGSFSSLDNLALRGATLAINEINAAGGILGKKVALVTYDGATDPELITTIAQKLVTQHEIIIGLTDTDMAIAALPPIIQAQKIFITTGATSPKLFALAPQQVFLACFTDNTQATAAAYFMKQTLDAAKVSIVTQKDLAYAILLTQYFKNSFLHVGGKILNHIQLNHDDSKATIETACQVSQAPDAFYVAAGPELAPKIVRAIRKAGFTQPIVGGDSFDNKKIFTFGATNIYFTTHAFMHQTNPDPALQRFIKAYEKTYGTAPDSSFAALGYDTIKLVAAAIQQAGSEKIAATLLNTKVPGLTGTISALPTKPVSIVQIQKGKRSLVSTWNQS